MVEVKSYHLRPTQRIPNSHYPLLHYKGVLSDKANCEADKAYDLFTGNGWKVNWIFRYGDTQMSHYHSRSHECMAVLTGNATIRFGVADTSDDMEGNTYGSDWEKGGVELEANAGDVFLIPAGVAHKTYRTRPSAPFVLLSPGHAKGIAAPDPRKALQELPLDGFTMLGAYPIGADWDFIEACTDHADWEKTWAIPKPALDPVLGDRPEGITGLWKGRRQAKL